jgi:hypothetical protein
MNCKGKFTETRGHTSLAALVHDASVMNVRLPLADWLLHRLVKDGKGRARPLTHFGALQTVLKENTKNGIAQELRATPEVRSSSVCRATVLYILLVLFIVPLTLLSVTGITFHQILLIVLRAALPPPCFSSTLRAHHTKHQICQANHLHHGISIDS